MLCYLLCILIHYTCTSNCMVSLVNIDTLVCMGTLYPPFQTFYAIVSLHTLVACKLVFAFGEFYRIFMSHMLLGNVEFEIIV